MYNFEEKLQKLEHLSEDIKRGDISIEDAIKDFEEGIKLARGMEKELDAIEGKIQILMNSPDDASAQEEEKETSAPAKKTRKTPAQPDEPVLDLFNSGMELNGTRNA
ncbi:MAG TPA: exodeoxyribonuclease VII small subunit [Treponema sp.]|nr:exodeoxyribonuclease VII small subunit [Treponema sp.]